MVMETSFMLNQNKKNVTIVNKMLKGYFAEHRHVFISACANKEANTIFNSTLYPVCEVDSGL